MKSFITLAIALIIVSVTANKLSSQTIKERIDQVKEVKVYFRNADILSKASLSTQVGTTSYGTGCEDFKETTPFSPEYVEAINQTIDLLNKGFNTTVFIAGDFKTINDLPLNREGELNWLKLGEPLTFFFSTSGAYYVRRTSGSTRENSLELQSYLYVYSVADGKLKTLDSKYLASAKAPAIKSEACGDYAYFTKNFPLSALLESFKTDLAQGTTEFTEKQMEKYNKAMKKKK